MPSNTVSSRSKAASKYRTGKTTKRKPPKRGKTTVRPTRILSRPGIKIKRTF